MKPGYRLMKHPPRVRASYNITQPWFDEDMAHAGGVESPDVFPSDDYHVSPVLDARGDNLVYMKEPMGFVLRVKE